MPIDSSNFTQRFMLTLIERAGVNRDGTLIEKAGVNRDGSNDGSPDMTIGVGEWNRRVNAQRALNNAKR